MEPDIEKFPDLFRPYGSFLQAYALKQLIEELSCKVEFVDYHVGAPVITENADSKNKFVRKVEKGLETFLIHSSSIQFVYQFLKSFIKLGIITTHTMSHSGNNLIIVRYDISQCINVLHRNNRSHSLRHIPCELNLMVVHMLIELMLTRHNNRSLTYL